MKFGDVDHKDVQALFRGFDKRWPVGRFYYCRYESSQAGHELLQHIGTLTSFYDLDNYPPVAINAALTYRGLCKLQLNPDVLGGFPGDFRQGMRDRAQLNRDVGDNAPEKWDPLWQGEKSVHLWIGVYAKSSAVLAEWDQAFRNWIAARSSGRRFMKRSGPDPDMAVTLLDVQDVRRFWSDTARRMDIDDESTNPRHPVVLEHFGFRDGVSQPSIEGLDLDANKTRNGGGRLLPDGSWSAIPPGEFLFGHVDVMGEMPLAPVPPALSHNGSFMVQRKLEQDVDGFREYLKKLAEKSTNSQEAVVKADYLAAKIIGRHRDGTPLADAEGINDFRYSEDLEGTRCPLGAHMRRANPRDSLGLNRDVCMKNGSTLVDRHRILRRAITYGDPVPTDKKQKDVNPDGQGLMFMTLQTDITRQFEFVHQQWINFGNDLNQGNDRDPLVGVQAETGRLTIPGDAENPTVVCGKLPQFVRTRGGDYFFMPSVSAFSRLAGGQFLSINTEG